MTEKTTSWGRRAVLKNSAGITSALIATPWAYLFEDGSVRANQSEYPNVVPPDLQIGEYGYRPERFIDPIDVAITTDDLLYILDQGNDRVQVFDTDGNLLRIWGRTGTGESQLSAPEGIASGQDAQIYVADTGNHRVQIFTSDGEFLEQWGSFGSAEGNLRFPKSVDVRSQNIYVADTMNHRVQVFDRSQGYILGFGEYGENAGQFNQPVGVAVDNEGYIYVADSNNNRIQKFDPEGDVEKTWGEYGSLSGMFSRPTDLSVHDREMYVTDNVNHRIQVFDTDGNYRYQWGRHPPTAELAHEGNNGRLHYPKGITASPSGEFVMVCEPFENRSKLFKKSSLSNVENVDDSAWWEKGTRFHYGSKPMASAELLAVSEPDTHSIVLFDIGNLRPRFLTRFGGFGREPGQFISATGCSFDVDRNLLYASDMGNHRIQVFDIESRSSPKYVGDFGEFGSGEGEFREPGGQALDSDGNIYVCDVHNNRIQVFGPEFEYLHEWGEFGTEEGQFNAPLEISIKQEDGLVYVVDSYNRRVQAFDQEGTFQFEWGGTGASLDRGAGRFVWPFGVEAELGGAVYVTDASGQRIQQFNRKGRFIREWGRFGAGPGEFYKPKGIAQSDEGILYVMDFGNHRGQIFTKNGAFIDVFGIGVLQETPTPSG